VTSRSVRMPSLVESDAWVNWSKLATLLTGFGKSVAEPLEHLLGAHEPRVG
jgi:hypothetical protein